MPESDQELEDFRQKAVEARVRRETIVDQRLDGHDRRLAQINGQLERGARATETVAERLQTLANSVVDLRGEIHTKGEVDEALRQKADAAIKSQITRREFWMGIAVIVISIISVAINAGVIK